MSTWHFFIKVGFRAFILPKEILFKFQNLENKIYLLKIFGVPKSLLELYFVKHFNYYTKSFNSLWIFNQHHQIIQFNLFL
jgi:hypothetical protein